MWQRLKLPNLNPANQGPSVQTGKVQVDQKLS